jgi:mono/diheme cytochrome c family protein
MFNFVYNLLGRLGYHHPIHPTEVHMPIGLVVGGVVFVLTALIFRRERLVLTTRHCTILAFIWVFPTMLLGFMDWQHFYGGAWLFPIKMKLMLAPLLAGLLFLSVLFGKRFGPAARPTLTVYFLAFCAVVALGYFGGQLVYGSRTPPSPQTYKKGEKLFHANCASCHPNGGNRLRPSMPLRSAPQLKALDTFVAFIRNPKPPGGGSSIMPPFSASRISDREAKELYDYIVHTLVPCSSNTSAK